jgi:putative endonuclease
MLNPFQRFGRRAEELAARHLKENGYKILQKNYRTRSGEIDLIALDGEVLVFVEVKARRSERFGTPKEALSIQKQRKIVLTARHYLKESGKQEVRVRFDMVSILMTGSVPAIEVVKNAFDIG